MHIPPGTASQQVAELRSTAETKQLVQELAVAGSRGVVDALSEDETSARVRALVEQIARALVVDLRGTLEGLQPAARQLTADLATTAVRSMAPALRQLVVDLMRDPELRQSLGGMSRELGKEAVLGSNDAIQALEAERKKTPLGAVAKAFSSIPLLLGIGLMVLVGVPVGLLWRQRNARRHGREEGDRRASIAAAILRSAEISDAAALQRLIVAVAETLDPSTSPRAPRYTRLPKLRRPQPRPA